MPVTSQMPVVRLSFSQLLAVTVVVPSVPLIVPPGTQLPAPYRLSKTEELVRRLFQALAYVVPPDL